MAEMDTQVWRDRYDKLGSRFDRLYQKRMPALMNYEKMVNSTLSNLIGETLPAAKQHFDEASGIGDVISEEYTPALREHMQSARDYDTPERRAEASGRAMTDVMTASDTAREASLARLEAYGIDPSVTRSSSLDANAKLAAALEAVKQGRDASTGVEERGRQYMSEALGQGAQGAGLQMGLGQAGSGMLTSATNAANVAGNTWANVFGTPMQNLEEQKNLITSSIAAKEAEVKSKQAAGGGSPWAGIGQTVGMVGGAALGAYAGGPAGMMAGAQLGGALGGAAGGAAGGTGGGGGTGGFTSYGDLPSSWGSSGGGSGTAQANQLPPIY